MASNPKQNQPEKPLFDEADDGVFLSAQQFCNAPIYAAVLNAALELNLFDIIAKATPSSAGAAVLISATEIASHLPTQHPDLPCRLDRMLRLLATNSLLTCSTRIKENGGTETLYGLSPTGKFLVNDDNDDCLAPISKFMCHRPLLEALFNLKEGILHDDNENDLFKKVHGMSLFKYTQIDPISNHLFNEAMATTCHAEMRRVLQIYRGFEGISTLVDVGGGVGQSLKMILSKHASIKGINFDLPQVIQNAQPYPGIEHIEGDMFASVPRGDAILLKSVCHNWSDENCVKVLSNCYKALKQNGKVIVIDCIVPEVIEPTDAAKLVANIDNLMFLLNGRERSENEFEILCKRSGFSGLRIICRAFSAFGVMEFYK